MEVGVRREVMNEMSKLTGMVYWSLLVVIVCVAHSFHAVSALVSGGYGHEKLLSELEKREEALNQFQMEYILTTKFDRLWAAVATESLMRAPPREPVPPPVPAFALQVVHKGKIIIDGIRAVARSYRYLGSQEKGEKSSLSVNATDGRMFLSIISTPIPPYRAATISTAEEASHLYMPLDSALL